MADTISFMREFKRQVEVLPGVRSVEFFGSVLNPRRFKPGKSDVDVVIKGNPDQDTKDKIRRILKELSGKYGLQMEKSPYLHPVPFYIHGVAEELLFKHFIIEMPKWLLKWRSIEKAQPSLTVGERWSGIQHPSLLVRMAELIWG